MLAEYGLDHIYIREHWTMAQFRAMVRRRNERIQREREHYEQRSTGGGGGGRRQTGLAELVKIAKTQRMGKRLKVQQRKRAEAEGAQAND